MENLTDYQYHRDGTLVAHQGEAYFMKTLDDMGYHLTFLVHSPKEIDLMASHKKNNKTVHTVYPHATREKAMGQILDMLNNPSYGKTL